jgi:hypothetical protein
VISSFPRPRFTQTPSQTAMPDDIHRDEPHTTTSAGEAFGPGADKNTCGQSPSENGVAPSGVGAKPPWYRRLLDALIGILARLCGPRQ